MTTGAAGTTANDEYANIHIVGTKVDIERTDFLIYHGSRMYDVARCRLTQTVSRIAIETTRITVLERALT